MYEESIDLLRKCGIRLEKGLSLSELNKAEKLYQIQFPESLKNFLMIASPISKGFYNWRNTQKSNVQFIKDIMERPFQDINEAADIVYWCDDWGVEPTNTMNFASEVRKKLKNAPKLLPIYAANKLYIFFLFRHISLVFLNSAVNASGPRRFTYFVSFLLLVMRRNKDYNIGCY